MAETHNEEMRQNGSNLQIHRECFGKKRKLLISCFWEIILLRQGRGRMIIWFNYKAKDDKRKKRQRGD